MGADRIVLGAGRTKFRAQRLDMRIDGAVGAVGIAVPAAVHQLRTAEDGAGALQQGFEQDVFITCQIEDFPTEAEIITPRKEKA